jgi:hypothetical protein
MWKLLLKAHHTSNSGWFCRVWSCMSTYGNLLHDQVAKSSLGGAGVMIVPNEGQACLMVALQGRERFWR